MPRVPGGGDISPVQRSAVNQPLSGLRATAETFGAGVARANQEAGKVLAVGGGVVTKEAFDQVVAENKLELEAAFVAQSKAEKSIFFGDGTPDNPGFGSLEGQAAIDAHRSARDNMLAEADAIAEGLSTQKQRDRYRAGSAQAMVDFEARLGDHTTRQRKVASERMAEARAQEQADNAVHDYNDDNRMDGNFAVMEAAAENLATTRGLTGVARVSFIEKQVSAVAVVAVEAAIADGDPGRAKELLAKYTEDGSLDGSDIPALQKKLKDGKLRVESQEIADAIFAQTDDPEKALALAREAPAGAVRDAVLSRVTQRNAEIVRRDTKARQDASREADQFVENGGNPLDLPASTRELLTAEKLESLKRISGDVQAGVPSVTDWDRYDFYTTLSTEELANVDLGIAKTELAPKEFTTLKALVTSARGPGKQEANPFTPLTVFNTAVLSTDFAPKRRENSKRKKKRGLLKELYLSTVAQMDLNNGPKKRLTNVEHRQVFDDLVKQVVVDTYLFGLIEDEEPLFTVEVPAEDRAEIVQAIEESGEEATEAEIRRVFLRFQEGQ